MEQSNLFRFNKNKKIQLKHVNINLLFLTLFFSPKNSLKQTESFSIISLLQPTYTSEHDKQF